MSIIKPVLRIFDYDKTVEFYIGWLGFKIDWTHIFEPGTPRFMQVSLKDVMLFLSEHHGDSSPGVHIHIMSFEGLEEYHRQITAKNIDITGPVWRFHFGMKTQLQWQ